jgi:hypothetical protein
MKNKKCQACHSLAMAVIGKKKKKKNVTHAIWSGCCCHWKKGKKKISRTTSGLAMAIFGKKQRKNETCHAPHLGWPRFGVFLVYLAKIMSKYEHHQSHFDLRKNLIGFLYFTETTC